MMEDPERRDLLAAIAERKREGRRELAKLPFGEKIARIQAMRERLLPLKLARERRQSLRRDNKTEPE